MRLQPRCVCRPVSRVSAQASCLVCTGGGRGEQGGSSTWLVPELPRGSEALCPHCSSGSSDPTSAQDLTWPPSNWRQVSQVLCHLLLPCGEAV